MTYQFNEYIISDEKSLINMDSVKDLLSSSYWAEERSIETILRSIDQSVCYGIFKGNGLGKKLVEVIVTDEKFKDLMGILATRDAHGLYAKFGFERDDGRFMRKPRK